MGHRWISYGITGAIGVSLVAGGAVATAATMELHTTDGTTVPGGSLTGTLDDATSTTDLPTITLRVTDTHVTVVSAPAPSAVTPATAASPIVSTPTPVSAVTPVTPATVATPTSSNTPVTPPSAGTVASAPSA